MSASGPDVFEERLLRELMAFQRRHHAVQVALDPTSRVAASRSRAPAAAPSARPRHRRARALVLSGTVVACVVALVVALLAALLAPRADRGGRAPDAAATAPSASPTFTSPPAVVSSLRLRMIAAVSDAPRDAIVHSTSRLGSVTSEAWSDQATFALRLTTRDASNRPVRDVAMRRVGPRGETLRIDVRARTWSLYTTVISPSESEHLGSPPDVAAAWRATLTGTPGMRTIGTEIVDGVETTHVRFALAGGGVDDAWVDTTTFLPVKQVSPIGTSTYQWLPRTDANLAALWPTPPADFHQVAPPEPSLAPGSSSTGPARH